MTNIPELISSTRNPKIKELLELQEKSRERRRTGLFVVEGRREIQHCIEAGFVPDTIFVCPEIYGGTPEAGPSADMHLCRWVGPTEWEGTAEGQASGEPRTFRVTAEVYDKIAYRGGTEGIIAEMKARACSLEDLKLGKNPLIIVMESVEKPGNLGAVLRSADAAGADAVIICDPLTDLYNPNLIRASIGAVFTVPTVACTSEEAISFLKGKGIRILTAQLQDSALYYDTDMTGGTAIVMGTESTGLTDIWRQAADAHIRIPMLGRLDSLNVSVSAAILLFEALRQRQ